jgi:ATP-dependent protease HslVU (ClpYQ) peptidase subunit
LRNTELTAEAIVRAAMDVTAEICIFTNSQITVEIVSAAEEEASDEAGEERS